MKQAVFALVDCNNFFVSCERLFRPELAQRPVVVLSSNDGCAVSRSNEAKALGIPMGAPAFKYQQQFREQGVVQFSANFELYGDLSRRITELLTSVTPRIEVYSVDESFLDLSQLAIKDYGAWGRQVRQLLLEYTGIPVSTGIAPTKTLAKIATDRAKQHPELQGACDLYHTSTTERHTALKEVSINNVWGVGRRLAPQLRAEGIATAADLASQRPARARQLLGIHGEQMVRELNGQSCLPLEREHKVRQSIARTRTFGQDTAETHVIEAAIASFAAQAAFRLRRSHQLAHQASLFLTTDRHKPNYRRWSQTVKFDQPTADTGQIIAAMTNSFSQLYDPQALYHRGGVMLGNFVPDTYLQTDLLGQTNVALHQQRQARSLAVDQINSRYGQQTVHYAAEDLAKGWRPKQQLKSPAYTTNWAELPAVKIYA